jgi:pimeloyl-ACP methyl ester carboxylesterase
VSRRPPTVHVDGLLSHRVEGSGPPLLLIHGWGLTFSVWENLVPLLRPHFLLVMVELPGIGASPPIKGDSPYYGACADALDRLRAALSIENWSVLSYSAGTRAGEAYAERYPERVAAALFLCPIEARHWGYACLSAEWWLQRLAPPLEWLARHAPPLARWLLSGWRMQTMLRILLFNGRQHPRVGAWRQEIEEQSLSDLRPKLYEMPGIRRETYADLLIRALWIWGKRDVMTRPPRRPQSEDVIIDATHGAPLTAAAEIADVLLRFLGGATLKAR